MIHRLQHPIFTGLSSSYQSLDTADWSFETALLGDEETFSVGTVTKTAACMIIYQFLLKNNAFFKRRVIKGKGSIQRSFCSRGYGRR